MQARKRKHQSNAAKDPTTTWRSKIRPNNGFSFSRRTRSMSADGKLAKPAAASATPCDDDTSEARTGGGFQRFQKGRPGSSKADSIFEFATASDETTGVVIDQIDQGVTTKSFRQNQNKKHADDTSNTNKKDDGAENHQGVIPVRVRNSHGEEGGHFRSLSCGEQKKSENSASAASISTIPINRKANLESWHQEMMKTAKKKKKHNTFDIPITITTVNKSTNKKNDQLGTGSGSRKNLDQACNDEKYGCNYQDDDKLPREELKRGEILQPASSSSLLTKANLLELSRKESSTVEEPTSLGKREGSGEKDEEEPPNVPKTSLLRNRTEASIDVMGLSPLAELRKRAASVDEDFHIGNRPSSSVATSTMKIQREQQSSPRSHHFHHYAQFPSRAMMETDSDSEPSSPGESDGETDRYYSYSNQHYSSSSSSSSRHHHDYRPRTPKPKQLLDQFDAVATPEGSAKTSGEKTDPHPKDRNQCLKNDKNTIKDLRGDEQDGASNDVVPKYSLGKKHESGNNRESTLLVSHPSKHTAAVLDEMIATALESQTKKAKSTKSKRKGEELTRNETGNRRDNGSNNKNKKRDAFKRKDRSSTGPPQKKRKLIFDDETKNSNNARRVSLESPPATIRRHQNQELPNDPKPGKPIAGDGGDDDDSSSCWSNLRQQRPIPKPSLRQRRLDFDDDSSDWSADWDNLSIESIPRHRCPRREDTSDDRPHGVATFVEVSFDSFENEDENVPSASKAYIRRSYRRTNVLNNRCSEKISKELFPPNAISHRKTISNPAHAFDGLFSSGEDDDDDENVPYIHSSSREFLAMDPTLRRVCRSRSGSANGVKKVCIITNQSIRRILLLLYVYIVLRAVHDQCNHQSLGTIRSSFGGIKKIRLMRPRIWFSENPSLSLFQASQMHEPIMM